MAGLKPALNNVSPSIRATTTDAETRLRPLSSMLAVFSRSLNGCRMIFQEHLNMLNSVFDIVPPSSTKSVVTIAMEPVLGIEVKDPGDNRMILGRRRKSVPEFAGAQQLKTRLPKARKQHCNHLFWDRCHSGITKKTLRPQDVVQLSSDPVRPTLPPRCACRRVQASGNRGSGFRVE